MDIGVCVASHIGDIDYVVQAEALGYSHAWLADSQMLWSDCFACLALAAERTSTIQLGTGVAIAGTRSAAVHASSIATINALAPGRTFFGSGAGNTATRVMGLPPMRIKPSGDYLDELVPLIRGDETNLHETSRDGDAQIPIRHIMPDKGFVNFEDKIPVYISGFGPKSLALAGKHGDGAVMTLPTSPGAMEQMWHNIEKGASEAGRSIDRDQFYTTALTSIVVLAPGEAVTSERVKSQCGAMAMAAVHFAYDQFRNFGHQPPNPLHGIWDDYVKLIESYPADRRHQRIHAGHNCWVLPEEEQFLNEDVLKAANLIGSQEELISFLGGLKSAGLDQVMILPSFDTRYDVLNEVAEALVGNVVSL